MTRAFVRRAVRAALALAFAVPAALHAQSSPLADTIEAIRDAEDARAATGEQLAVLRAGLASPSVEVRRLAVRALGRLQRASLIGEIAPALGDPSAAVRAEAAIALLHASALTGAADARAALLPRLDAESDPGVVAAIAEATGWSVHTGSGQVRATAEALVARLGSVATAPRPVAFGVARGLFGLARQTDARGALPASVVARLEQLAAWRRASTGRTDVDVRELAVLALAGSRQATTADFERALADPAMAVRAAAARTVYFALADSDAAERLGLRATHDAAMPVRAAAVVVYGIRFGAHHRCAPLLPLLRDPAPAVRTSALDVIGLGCEPDSPAAAIVDSIAGTLPAPRSSDAGAWHVPAHALVALAGLAPDRARARMAPFVASPDLFVRTYAAQAAARLGDVALLRRLAADAHPNVRSAAVNALSSVAGHAADDVYLAALDADDSQLLQAAAAALAKSTDPRVPTALFRALDRVSAAKSETSRDARAALINRVQELGDTASATRLRPYLADFDTLIAARVADAIGSITGTRPTPAPVLLPRQPMPTSRELAALARSRVVLEMAGPDGGRVVFRLFPYEAPTNAARVAKLAREGKLDGLTFHRAVLGRFMQGGSPMANEYAGWGAYSRDEFAVGHHRGVVSMSTRGYDTADGQIVLHVTDSFQYDHAYTVIGEIVSGQEVVDRMQEGARIRHASVRP